MFFGKKEDDLHWRTTSEKVPGPHTSRVIDNWIQTLPEGDLLDLAAGQGIESAYMNRIHSRRVSAYDTALSMRHNAVYTVENANIFKMHYGRESYAGALIKDAWVFFSPNDRTGLLQNLYKGLIRGGSVLIMSEWSDTRAHVIPEGSSFPQKYLLSDYENARDWINALAREKHSGGKVISIEYEVNEATFNEEASSAGFDVNVQYFGMGTGLSMENRWKQSQQYVAILRK